MRVDTAFPSPTAAFGNDQTKVGSTQRQIEPPVTHDKATADVSATASGTRTARVPDTVDVSRATASHHHGVKIETAYPNPTVTANQHARVRSTLRQILPPGAQGGPTVGVSRTARDSGNTGVSDTAKASGATASISGSNSNPVLDELA